MTYSKKLEDIPSERLTDLKTYLNEVHAVDSRYARLRAAARESDLDKATVHTVFTELSQEGTLQAKIEIRCPECDTQHGIYEQKSSVPSEMEVCFNCGAEFQPAEKRNWEVIYSIVDSDADFFPSENWHIQRYVEDKRDCSPAFFKNELQRFREMDNPQKRGREFDYLMGLLFQQLEGVEVRLKEGGTSGEVDVRLSCLDAPKWLHRLVGGGTMVENKWEKNPIQKGEIIDFHEKTRDLLDCNVGYFVSMSGFSRGSGKKIGALGKLKSYSDPHLIDFWEDDVEQMVEDGTPEPLLRERQRA